MSLKQSLKEHFKDEPPFLLSKLRSSLEKHISISSIAKQVYKCLGLRHTEQRPSAHEAAVLGAVRGSGGVLLHSHIPLHPSFPGRAHTPAPLTCLSTLAPLEHALINGVFLSVLRGPIMSL